MGHQFGGQPHVQHVRRPATATPAPPTSPAAARPSWPTPASPGRRPPGQQRPVLPLDSFDEIIAFVDDDDPGVGTPDGHRQPRPDRQRRRRTSPSRPARPFALTATGTDANGDTLTYDWEQRDLGAGRRCSRPPTTGTSPLFRVVQPDDQPDAHVPAAVGHPERHQRHAVGEKLPAVGPAADGLPRHRPRQPGRRRRRQHRRHGRSTSSTPAPRSSSPSPNTAVTWAGGSTQTVTWNVAGTTGSGDQRRQRQHPPLHRRRQHVPDRPGRQRRQRRLRVDHRPATSRRRTARIKVEPTNNIFFDISNANFTITAAPVPPPTVAGVQVNDGDGPAVAGAVADGDVLDGRSTSSPATARSA